MREAFGIVIPVEKLNEDAKRELLEYSFNKDTLIDLMQDFLQEEEITKDQYQDIIDMVYSKLKEVFDKIINAINNNKNIKIDLSDSPDVMFYIDMIMENTPLYPYYFATS